MEDTRPWWRRPVRSTVVGVLYLLLVVGAVGVAPYALISNFVGVALAFALGREPQEWKARPLRIALLVVGLIAGSVAHPEGFRILDAELRLPEVLFTSRVYAVGFPVLEVILAVLHKTRSRHQDTVGPSR